MPVINFVDSADAVRQSRATATAIRGIKARQEKGGSGRNASATLRAIARYRDVILAADAFLLGRARGRSWQEMREDRLAVGWLGEERDLAERLRGIPRGERPELRVRRSIVRVQLLPWTRRTPLKNG